MALAPIKEAKMPRMRKDAWLLFGGAVLRDVNMRECRQEIIVVTPLHQTIAGPNLRKFFFFFFFWVCTK